jgi:hypothetical protein
MLPKVLEQILERDDFINLTSRLTAAISGDYMSDVKRESVVKIIEELTKKTYKKGRLDERYYSGGPRPSASPQ